MGTSTPLTTVHRQHKLLMGINILLIFSIVISDYSHLGLLVKTLDFYALIGAFCFLWPYGDIARNCLQLQWSIILSTLAIISSIMLTGTLQGLNCIAPVMIAMALVWRHKLLVLLPIELQQSLTTYALHQSVLLLAIIGSMSFLFFFLPYL